MAVSFISGVQNVLKGEKNELLKTHLFKVVTNTISLLSSQTHRLVVTHLLHVLVIQTNQGGSTKLYSSSLYLSKELPSQSYATSGLTSIYYYHHLRVCLSILVSCEVYLICLYVIKFCQFHDA